MAEINRKKFKIFSLNANRPLAQEIADRIGVPLSDLTVNRFADGEVQVNINETVRGHHVFVVQPTHNPVNENLMELLVMIDALKRASAKTINVIMPYYGYSRQDRKAKARQPITAKLVANLIEAAGATRVMTMDLHATQIQGFFDIPIDDFRAMPIIAKYFIDKNLDEMSRKMETMDDTMGETDQKRALAMAYVPWQRWGNTYEPSVALKRGTLYPDLDFPFIGEEAVPR